MVVLGLRKSTIGCDGRPETAEGGGCTAEKPDYGCMGLRLKRGRAPGGHTRGAAGEREVGVLLSCTTKNQCGERNAEGLVSCTLGVGVDAGGASLEV